MSTTGKSTLHGLFGTIVARPVGFLVAFVTLILIGLIAYRRTPVELFPDGWSEPSLYAWIPNPGSSASSIRTRPTSSAATRSCAGASAVSRMRS